MNSTLMNFQVLASIMFGVFGMVTLVASGLLLTNDKVEEGDSESEEENNATIIIMNKDGEKEIIHINPDSPSAAKLEKLLAETS